MAQCMKELLGISRWKDGVLCRRSRRFTDLLIHSRSRHRLLSAITNSDVHVFFDMTVIVADTDVLLRNRLNGSGLT